MSFLQQPVSCLQRPDQRGLAVLALVGAGAFYLLLAGQPSPHEIEAALGVTVLSAAYSYVLYRAGRWTLALPAASVRELARAVATIPADMLAVGRALLTRTHGTLDRAPFPPGGDAESAGWRATAGIAASLAPNGYLLDVEEDGTALIHRLAPQRDA